MSEREIMSVKIITGHTEGSGFFLSSDTGNVFVITAKHCIVNKDGQEDQNVEIFDYEENLLKIKRIINSDSYDFSVIEIEGYSSYGVPHIESAKNYDTKDVWIHGYPHINKDEIKRSSSLRGCVIDTYNEIEIFKVLIEGTSLESNENTAHENTVGYSGSPVISIENAVIKIIGMITELPSKGMQNCLQALDISIILNLIKKDFGEEFTSIPHNFDVCLGELTQLESEKLKNIYQFNYSNNLIDITPQIIFEILRGKLVVPDDIKFDYCNKVLWSGWLKLLIYKSIQKNGKLIIKDITRNFTDDRNTHFFFSSKVRMNDFIEDIFTSEMNKVISQNDIVLVNNPCGFFKGKMSVEQEKLEKVITQIDNPYLSDGQIDNPSINNQFSVVHLQYIDDQIQHIVDEAYQYSNIQFVQKIKEKIIEIIGSVQ